MREIKFRAWEANRKVMNYKVMVGNTDENDENYTCSMVLHPKGWVHVDKYSNVFFMQYTGLKDRNGKEIYEGDILRFDNGETCVPKFIGAQFTLDFNDSIYNSWDPEDLVNSGIEVVGHIYEEDTV